MVGVTDDLAARIRADLRAVADPDRAPGQQAYMKSPMPFLGVRVPDARLVAKRAAKGTDAATLRATSLELWDTAGHREERYAALALLALPPLRGDLALVPLVEHMVRTGRWWDFTDELAHRLAELHDARPAATAVLVRAWAHDDDLWIRRIAILSQLGRGIRLDPDLLADTIEPNLADPEFFLRKAIGWALREYGRVAPEWVRRYVDEHALSPLSRREALKHL
ncbi:DNA alkylation repair enzyme [Microbacterium trichothecenolyticum]|uniref:DNA alkylation repair enzyme n=1 Tax=Microbacterium trichothecenolyticum TaxID=69370 RepID=A0A0M2H6M5_MICTR|nr:DNA alkylation repair enzyme [Microbacterium trichothecenolyticum]